MTLAERESDTRVQKCCMRVCGAFEHKTFINVTDWAMLDHFHSQYCDCGKMEMGGGIIGKRGFASVSQ